MFFEQHSPRRTVKDGEVICLCHGMRFTDIHKAQDVLQQKGNSRFADCVVRVRNVAKDGEKVDVYAVLMGAALHQPLPYLGIRRFPNCVIEMDCTSGSTRSFLKIICQTATGQGRAWRKKFYLFSFSCFPKKFCLPWRT